MRHTRTTRALWIVVGVVWACILVNAVWIAAPTNGYIPPLGIFLNSNAAVSGAQTVTLTLVAWQLLTPLSRVWEVAAWMTGQRVGCTCATQADNVVRLPRPRDRASMS